MCPLALPTRSGNAWLTAPMALLLAGCAHVHVDEQGRRHVVGFVVITVPAAEGRTGADTLRTRSLGLTLTRSPVGDALTLGWNDTSLTAVRDHSLVNLPEGEEQ